MATNQWCRVLVLLVVGVMLAGCAARNIFEASRNGNEQQVRDLLKKDPELARAVNVDQVPGDHDNRWTPLHYAARAGHTEIARMLLEAGADPLAKARGGWTPLHTARQYERQAIEKLIIEKVKETGGTLP